MTTRQYLVQIDDPHNPRGWTTITEANRYSATAHSLLPSSSFRVVTPPSLPEFILRHLPEILFAAAIVLLITGVIAGVY